MGVQLRELREYVSRRQWEPAVEYIDAGFSGAKASRPALDRLMAAADRRDFDCVLVWKIDRFGRSVLNLSQHLALLTSYGVRFIAVSQALDTDASNPSSRLMLTILAGVVSSSARSFVSVPWPACTPPEPRERLSAGRAGSSGAIRWLG